MADSSTSSEHEQSAPVGVAPQAGRSARHWLLEGVLIVVSVLLGFALSEFREVRAERELTARVLNGIKSEIEHNLRLLQPFVPMHAQWMQALEKAGAADGQAGLDVWFATRPPLPPDAPSPFPSMRRSAWDAAVVGGSLRLVDYDVAAALTDVYGMQEIASANLQRLANGPLSSPATYDTAQRTASVRLLWLTLADIQSAEALLLARYREHLPAITAAADSLR